MATSRWSDLVLMTYEVPEDVVRRHLPHPSVTPDRWDGKTHATVVALQFGTVHVAGVAVPASGDFPQLNLRVPVKRGDEAGVVFVRELVPSLFVASLARLLFRQPYETLPMRRMVSHHAGGAGYTVEYSLDDPPRGCVIVTGSEEHAPPARDSFEYYCMHRLAGFGMLPGMGNRLTRFPVSHPEWSVRGILRTDIQLDHGELFGAEWRLLNDLKPAALIFAVGSAVELHAPEPL